FAADAALRGRNGVVDQCLGAVEQDDALARDVDQKPALRERSKGRQRAAQSGGGESPVAGRGHARLLETLLQEGDAHGPRLLRGLEFGPTALRLGAKDAVPGAIEQVWLIALAELPQLLLRGPDRGVDALIVAAVEADDRGLHPRERQAVGRGSVIDHG